jgi:hypothetical protein
LRVINIALRCKQQKAAKAVCKLNEGEGGARNQIRVLLLVQQPAPHSHTTIEWAEQRTMFAITSLSTLGERGRPRVCVTFANDKFEKVSGCSRAACSDAWCNRVAVNRHREGRDGHACA